MKGTTITITIEESEAILRVHRRDGFIVTKTVNLDAPPDARKSGELVEGFAPDVREALEEGPQP